MHMKNGKKMEEEARKKRQNNIHIMNLKTREKRCEQHDKILQEQLKNSSSKRIPVKREEEYHRKVAENLSDYMISREKEKNKLVRC